MYYPKHLWILRERKGSNKGSFFLAREKNTLFYEGVMNMITIIILIYMVIGIMFVFPLFIIGLKVGDGLDQFDEDEIAEISKMLGIGIGFLLNIIIWPYWLVKCVYEIYLKPDED